MAIAHYNPTQPSPYVAKPTAAVSDNYHGNLYDNNKKPLSSLLAYVQGAPWAVEYYRQLLGEHNDLKELDDGLDAVYQSYELIRGLEIRVQSELTSNTDPATQQTTVSGSGHIYPFLVPNKNDYFITSTSLGKRALFRVDEVTRGTFQEQAVHTVSYKLVRYMDDSDTAYQSLLQKTVRTLYFAKDRLLQGLSPLLTTETFHDLQSFEQHYRKLVEMYFRTFFNQRSYTLVIPGQIGLIYDPFLMGFVLSITRVNDSDYLRKIKRYPTNEDIYVDQPQIWEALLKRDFSFLSICNREMGLSLVSDFDDNSFIRDAFHGVMYQMVYPRSVDYSAMSGSTPLAHLSIDTGLKPTVNAAGGHMLDSDNWYALVNRAVEIYPKIDFSSTYLFTPALYNNTESKTLLEIAVWDYLSGNNPKIEHLNVLIHVYHKLDRLEQFYYGPVLWLLLRNAIEGAY